MSLTELTQAIGRLRRSMPRNADAMLVCDFAEQQVIAPQLHGPDTKQIEKMVKEKMNLYWRDKQRKHRAKK